MKKIKFFYLLVSLLLVSFTSNLKSATPPDEGMWIPMWIEKLNQADMQKLGMRITAEEIYSINNSSIKDAIVGLGPISNRYTGFFCTGEIVSSKGLILTNHHCAYGAIQSLSSIENDYLTNGFWAMRHEEELPIEDMSISILQRIEDVTQKVLENVTRDMTEEARNAAINKAISEIEKQAGEKGKYIAHVSKMFYGSEFYLYVFQAFTDIRLVGVPPNSIGKFGGDTDNWMWPRHTGDFTYLRVYSAPDGSPAAYSKDNVPMTPKHHLPISIKGVEKNDFAMVFGFPGTTDRFLTSYGVEHQLKYNNPTVVKIRDKKLDVMKSYMDQSDEIRIQYAAKHAQTANYWKYFIGQTKGLKIHNVQQRRKDLENRFAAWVNEDDTRKEIYGSVLNDIRETYEEISKTSLLETYLQEAVFQGPEFIYFSFGMMQLGGVLKQHADAKKADKAQFQQAIKDMAESFKSQLDAHFKDYNMNLDKDLFIELIGMMYKDINPELHPEIFTQINKKFKGNFNAWADHVYSKSIFVDKNRLENFLNKPSYKALSNDPGWEITTSMITTIRKVFADRRTIDTKQSRAMRLFVEGLRLMDSDKKFYPNANSTLRMSYGKVLDYYPADAVHYDFVTTAQGIIEKEDPNNEEFIVPEKLISLIKNKDFGRYAKDGILNVCFISDNDITGGNSGSPVINADGHLIGIAFDGNWESMSGDIQFEPTMQRTINVDMRYVLFITEKFAGAKNLIQEMTIIE